MQDTYRPGKEEFMNLLEELQEDPEQYTPSGIIYHSEKGEFKRMSGQCLLAPCGAPTEKCTEDLMDFCQNMKAMMGEPKEIWCIIARKDWILAARVSKTLNVWRIGIVRSISLALTDAPKRLGPNHPDRKLFRPIQDFVAATGKLTG